MSERTPEELGNPESNFNTVIETGQDTQKVIEKILELGEHLELMLKKFGWDEDEILKISLGFNEAVINSAFHGNYGAKVVGDVPLYVDAENKIKALIESGQPLPQPVEVSYFVSSRQVKITLKDYGAGFDLKKVPNPLEKSNLAKTSGRGIIFIQDAFDEVSYSEGGRRLELTKTKT